MLEAERRAARERLRNIPELDRRLSPRYPTTEQAAARRRQRQRNFGSLLITLAGGLIAYSVSQIPYVWPASIGGVAIAFAGLAFFAIDNFSTRKETHS